MLLASLKKTQLEGIQQPHSSLHPPTGRHGPGWGSHGKKGFAQEPEPEDEVGGGVSKENIFVGASFTRKHVLKNITSVQGT